MKCKRFDILLISLDPTQGSEIKKTRPCVVISPDEMNKHIRTLIIAPMTSQMKSYSTRVPITFNDKQGEIVIDQLRTIDRLRVIRKLGEVDHETAINLLDVLQEMFSQ